MKSLKNIWQLSLLSFIIAAITGFLYRYGMIYPIPDWLNFVNIRHAHSHLMFFNWVCPPIMIWMVSTVLTSDQTKEINSFKRCLFVMLFLGFLSYPLFLLYGYSSVAIGAASLPLAAINSGLVMITWYWFAWLYYRCRKSIGPTISTIFFDGALAALMVSSLGAWGVSVLQFTTIDSPVISSALTHFFLAVFTEGWAVLGILGVLWSFVDIKKIPFNTNWLWQPVLFGSMLIFPFSLSESIITPAMFFTAKFGTILIDGSLALNLYLLFKSGRFKGFIWKTILVLIAIKVAFQFATMLPTGIWPGELGLRVLYLHVLMLGIVSILFIQVFSYRNSIPKKLFAGSVFLILLSLSMISGYWLSFLMLPDLYFWVMIVALLPVIPAMWLWCNDFSRSENQSIFLTKIL
ncbi:MAG: hypothetical protein WDZ29_02905 [Balneolaceae bacterium]